MILDSTIWGPHFWFFIHTIAISYPNYPNVPTKKKYYEFIQNIPLFIPNQSMANDFTKLLNLYPVQPYLDSRNSFVRWTWFIHNKLNEKLEKPILSLNDFYKKYYDEYKPKNIKWKIYYKNISKIMYVTILFIIIGIITYFLKF
jgi:hypothetical protein